GPSAQIQVEKKRMRQPVLFPSDSVKARTPPLEPASSETVLSPMLPTARALPWKYASKFAPPEPRPTGCDGSPLPLPCRRLPHSIAAFHTAIVTSWYPGKFVSGTVLSCAVGSVKLSYTRKGGSARLRG